MKTVGVRELKNRFSEYLRHVRSGESILVTDRGQVVAEIAPPGYGPTEPTVPVGLMALAKRGLLTVGSPGNAGLYPQLPRARRAGHGAADLLDEERGAR